MKDEYCDRCGQLDYEDSLNPYDVYAAVCCDPEKPMTGARRVVAVSGVGRPRRIIRPVWCRGKVWSVKREE